MSNNNKLEASHREYQCEFPRKFIRDFSRKYSRLFASIIITSIFLLPTSYFLLSTSVEAAPLQLQVKFPCPDFPGAPCPATPEKAAQSPAAYIARLYQFALALAGMLAFGMIIYGAIQYTVSAGNVAQQSDARDRIFQALWGVALLLGAYLILYTIDPKLVSLTDPNITTLAVPIEKSSLVGGGYKEYKWAEAVRREEGGEGKYFSYICPDGGIRVDEHWCGGQAPGSYYFCCAYQK